MKNIIRLFLITAVIATIVSCKDKSCYYDDQEYNSKTRQCECVQRFSLADIPDLKQDDYNTCLAVFRNFYYLSIDNKDYPYYSYAGDTILFCGYLGSVPEYAFENGDYLYTMGDDSTFMAEHYFSGDLTVRCSNLQLKDIDTNGKCFVKGILSFGFSDFQYESFPGPGHCLSSRLFFSVIDIKN